MITLIYIDGVSEVNISDGSLVLYADDIVLYRTIRSSSDYLYLQNAQPNKTQIHRKQQAILPPTPLTVMGTPLTKYPLLYTWVFGLQRISLVILLFLYACMTPFYCQMIPSSCLCKCYPGDCLLAFESFPILVRLRVSVPLNSRPVAHYRKGGTTPCLKLL